MVSLRDITVDLFLDASPTKHSFKLVGGPLDDPRSTERAFFVLGWLAMSWSRLEFHVDLMLIQINKIGHSDVLYDPEHPISFSRKLKLLKKWYRQHPNLASLRDALLKLADDRIAQLGNLRNAYIHALLETYDPSDDTVLLKSINPMQKDKFKIGEGKVPLKLLEELAAWINVVNAALAKVSREIFTHSALR